MGEGRICYLQSLIAAAAAKLLQSCPTLRDPIDGSPPGSPIPGILQARTLKWVATKWTMGHSLKLGNLILPGLFPHCQDCFGYVGSFVFVLEKAMASHSSTLAWKIPWTEEPGGLQSMGSLSQTRLSDFTFTFHFHALEKEMATHSSVLAWRIPGTVEPGGLPSMGSHRVGHD